jgi:hypothetical protein
MNAAAGTALTREAGSLPRRTESAMATIPGDSDEGRLDLVPMIDCIMLLLLFFMMTTKFTPEEKRIDTLLSTDHGTCPTPTHQDPPHVVHVCLYPSGLAREAQPSQYEADWQRIQASGRATAVAALQVGGREPLTVSGAQLATQDQAMQQQVEAIHGYITAELTKYVKGGAKSGQRAEQNKATRAA